MTHPPNILVIGGGISGLTAAIEAREAGAEVLLIEKNPYLGGRVAQMNLYFPKLCPPSCGLEINLRRLREDPGLEVWTQAEVVAIRDDASGYRVHIQRKPRLVTEQCTACAQCVEVCPEEREDTFNQGLSKTRSIYLPFPTAYPLRYAIDLDSCLGAECAKCVEACEYDAIDLSMPEETVQRNFTSVIVATGWAPYDARALEALGYRKHPDIVTNLEMERMAAVDGPLQGQLRRPSNQGPLEAVAFVQCAGSRDENHLKYCSGVCCTASLKQVHYVRKQFPEAEIYLFYIDIRTPARLEDFLTRTTEKDDRLKLVKGKVARVDWEDGRPIVVAEDTLRGSRVRQPVDLVVLATGMVPQLPQLDGCLTTDVHGFCVLEESPPGILPVGSLRRPSDVAESVRDATGSTARALRA